MDVSRIIRHADVVADSAFRRYQLNEHDREDLRQEARIAAINAVSTFDQSRGDIEGYIATTVRNRIAKEMNTQIFIRTWERSHELEEVDLIDITPTEVSTEDAWIHWESARTKVSALSPEARIVLSWVNNPPPFLQRQFEGLRALIRESRKQGVDKRMTDEVGLRFIGLLCKRIGMMTVFSEIKTEMNELIKGNNDE